MIEGNDGPGHKYSFLTYVTLDLSSPSDHSGSLYFRRLVAAFAALIFMVDLDEELTRNIPLATNFPVYTFIRSG